MIKLIAFDLWSTLATRNNPHYHFSTTLKENFNLNIPSEQIIDCFEKVTQTKYWENEIDAYTELARSLNIEITKKNIFKIIAIRQKAENNIRLYDFTIELLKELKKQNYKTALITNSSRFIYDTVIAM
jgi:FMN phosphatase YigB (HAD superfamily)